MIESDDFQGSAEWALNRWLNPCVVRLSWLAYTGIGKTSRIEHPYWVLDYTVDSGISTRVGSRRAAWRERGERVAHFYPPNTGYWQWRQNPGDAIRGGYLVFHLENDLDWRRMFLQTACYARIYDSAGVIGRLLRQGAESATPSDHAGSFWHAQSTLCSVLARLASAAPLGGEDWQLESGPASSGLVAQADACMRARLSERITLQALAKTLGLSRSGLSHQYKAAAGRSPMQALLDFRVERAKSLLVQGLKLDDIAEQCGFHDAAHFSRVFVARTGKTPRRFARSQ